jgi:gliding motility-associated-like protein
MFLKKLLTFLLFSFALILPTKNALATHVMGGEITWECLANGQYVFTLKIYRDCNGVNFNTNNHALEVHNYPTVGNISQIPLAFFSVDDITASCEGSPCATLSPSDPDIPGAIEEYVLRSNPITLNGIPPAVGWVFTWTYGDRNAAIDNIINAQNYGITLRAKMFPYNGQNVNNCFDSSPNFFQKPSTIICAGKEFTYNHSAFDEELDSLSYEWARPLDGNFCNPTPCVVGGLYQENLNPPDLPLDVASGFSYLSPFPDTNLDNRNIPAVLDPETGEITFTSFNQGEYISVIKVSAWRCGQKIAEIYRELQTVITAGCAPNEPPQVITSFSSNVLRDTVKVGDFVDFNISIIDSLRAGNPKDDSLFIFASGLMFGNNFTDSTSGCPNPPCATLSRSTPDTGFSVYNTRFRWRTSCDQIANYTPVCNVNKNTYLFTIRAFDDYCPAAGQVITSIAITILGDSLVVNPEIYCADVQSNGDVNLSWQQSPDPDSAFHQWMIYSAPNRAGPYTLIDSIQDLSTTSYTDTGAGADQQSMHYIIKAKSGCNDGWSILETDTISTIFQQASFNNSCVELNWSMLSNPNPSGSDTLYTIYREYPIGSGFNFYATSPTENFCDTFDVCTDTVTYRIELVNLDNSCSSNSNIAGIRFAYPDPAVEAGNDVAICDGQSTMIGGSPSSPNQVDYLWSPSLTLNDDTLANPTASPSDTITYFLTVSDEKGCTATDSVIVNTRERPIATAGADSLVCIENFPFQLYGSVSISNSGRWIGGTGTFAPNRTTLNAVYTPSSTEIDSGFVDLQLITENIGICDPDTDQVRITIVRFTGNPIATVTDVSCFGANDGSISVNPGGGFTPYTYVWDDGPLTQNRSNLGGGTYTVTMTNTLGCDSVLSFVVNEPALLTVNISDSSDVSCFGVADGSARATINGGNLPYTIQWSDAANTSLDSVNGLSGGTYYISVTDAQSCFAIDSVMIDEPDSLVVNINSANNLSCFNAGDGSASIQIQGGVHPYSIQWDDPGNSTTDSIFNLAAGRYNVIVSDQNLCTDTASVLLTEPQALGLTVSLLDSVSCFGLSNGRVAANASGGTLPYSFQWDDPSSATSDTVANLTAGLYRVSLTDANGCLLIDSVQVGQADSLIVSLTFDQDISCFGGADGVVRTNTTGGTTPYSYLWSDNSQADSLNGVAAGTYQLTVTDSKSCTDTLSIVLNEPNPLTTTIDSVFNVSCNGLTDGFARVAANGGTPPYTYQWDDPANSTTAQINNLSNRLYNVTVTDANQCTSTNSVIINQPLPLATASISSVDISCFGFADGSASIVVSGGTSPYQYSWSNASDSSFIGGLSPGTYIVNVSDSNGCTLIDSVTINEPAQLQMTLDPDSISCNGFNNGTITTQVSGGITPYSFSWSNSQTTQNNVNLGPGTYTLTLTDENGCIQIDSAFIFEPDSISLNLTADDTICVNSAKLLQASATGGDGNYQYRWNQGLAAFPSQSVTPSQNTTYAVSVTDGNNCPTVIDSVKISVRNIFNESVSLDGPEVICLGESATLIPKFEPSANAIGPYLYVWNQGLNGLDSVQVSPTVTTLYTFDVIDGCNNSIRDSLLLRVSEPPLISLNDSLIEGCSPLRVQFDNGSPAGYTHFWDFGDGSSSNAARPTNTFFNRNNLGPESYFVSYRVQNLDGCESEFNGDFEIRVNPSPSSAFTLNRPSTNIDDPVVQGFADVINGDDLIWTFGDGDSAFIAEPIHRYEDTGTYLITLIKENEFGCRDTSFRFFRVEPVYEIRIPNVFTPRDGGSNGGVYDPNNPDNTVFFPFVEYAEEYRLSIFNRWGELMFETKDQNVGWDGYYKGKLCQSDVYVYKLEIRFINGQRATKVGDVTLLR